MAEATTANPGGPYIHITQFKVGSAVNYVPTGYVPGVSAPTQTALQGTELYSAAPLTYTVVDADTVEVLLNIPPSQPSFSFGEIGIYLQDGTLFAICVFDALQQHVHAVGNQAGTNWKIRARLKLQQLPALVNVTLVNSQAILEVPNWESLIAPSLQPNNANAAIVHDNNFSGDPVFVVRDGDLEWGLVGYKRLFSGQTTDSGASSTTTSFTHPGLDDILLEAPFTTSRYVAKFADGSIRKLSGNSPLTSIQWSPALGVAPTGLVTVWQENGTDPVLRWADTIEYNDYIAVFNPFWTTPSGTFSATNKGLNQTAFATLSRRTVSADWSALANAVRALCLLHNISTVDIDLLVDFEHKPTGPTPYGLQRLRAFWDAFFAKLALLEANRLVFNPAAFDTQIVFTHADSTFFSTRIYDFTFDTDGAVGRQALLNGGMQISLAMDVTSPVDPDWVDLDTICANMGTLTIFDDSVSRTGPGGSGELINLPNDGLYLLPAGPSFPGTTTVQYQRTFGDWTFTVAGYLNGSGDLVLRVQLENSAPYSYGGSPGTINFTWTATRPGASLINTPVLAFPTVSVVQT